MMDAKNYCFTHETIQSLATVECEEVCGENSYYVIKNSYYPLWNVELIRERIHQLKNRLKKEIEARKIKRIIKNKQVNKIIKELTDEIFKELRIRIITESGYKEVFYLDNSNGEYCFDLSNLKQVNNYKYTNYSYQNFMYNGEMINLADICPEYWKGRWTRDDIAI
ncbi:MAG: hypothetical protein ACRCSG_08040 [Cellulosilyticaceae bacterium]